ncbi:MAG: hypothetical protein RMK34_09855 [Tepidimonas sp.]|uniref:hypothetical protein n=1 Tax=Tepidimonas sp. TaxID=2002775 RepID=UPI00298F2D06|nr:hypothetical protein [Tepidimonas sp.]MCS6811786.1 hypothetical protein [Tepidimonas sp.]MDW8337254.1 hypothetical protein [Tepidimonas sp.]
MLDDAVQQEIAALAAALIVDDGWPVRTAQEQARQRLGLPARTALPGAALQEAAIRQHLALFHADTQPRELAALRATALDWMQRLAAYEPLLGGAVWHGTATRRCDIHLQLFSDDPKAVEIDLINAGLAYDSAQARGLQGREVPVLHLSVHCAGLGEHVGLHLWVNDARARRGARLPDALGRTPRGTAEEVRALLAAEGNR